MRPPSYVPNHSPNLLPSPDHHPRHHHRAPSLGELHQELESEQEGQVNRLLGMIRQQQAQLQSLQQPHGTQTQTGDTTSTPSSATSAATPSTLFAHPPPPRSRTPSTPFSPVANAGASIPRPGSAGSSTPSSARATPTLSRQASSRAHRQSNPPAPPASGSPTMQHAPTVSLPPHALRPRTPSRHSSYEISANTVAGSDVLGDEISFYRTETASLERENRMLKARIGELERLLGVGGQAAGNATTEDGDVGGANAVDSIPETESTGNDGDESSSRRGRWSQ